jgi:hypothetical protein
MNRRDALFPNTNLGLYRLEQNRRMPLIKQPHIAGERSFDCVHISVVAADEDHAVGRPG